MSVLRLVKPSRASYSHDNTFIYLITIIVLKLYLLHLKKVNQNFLMTKIPFYFYVVIYILTFNYNRNYISYNNIHTILCVLWE